MLTYTNPASHGALDSIYSLKPLLVTNSVFHSLSPEFYRIQNIYKVI